MSLNKTSKTVKKYKNPAVFITTGMFLRKKYFHSVTFDGVYRCPFIRGAVDVYILPLSYIKLTLFGECGFISVRDITLRIGELLIENIHLPLGFSCISLNVEETVSTALFTYEIKVAVGIAVRGEDYNSAFRRLFGSFGNNGDIRLFVSGGRYLRCGIVSAAGAQEDKHK